MSFKIIFTIIFLSLAFWLTNNHKYKFYIIQSGSMEPSFQIGDLVIIQLQTKYQNNDVITFKTKDNKIVTHRIINIVDKNNYFTKGDANRIKDFETTNPDNILGKVIQIIPKIGLLANFTHTNIGYITFFIIPLLWLKA